MFLFRNEPSPPLEVEAEEPVAAAEFMACARFACEICGTRSVTSVHPRCQGGTSDAR